MLPYPKRLFRLLLALLMSLSNAHNPIATPPNDVVESMPAQTLHIAEWGKENERIRKQFQALYPAVAFHDCTMDWEISDPVERMNIECPLDIFEITNESGFQRLLREGYVVDLSISSSVMKEYDLYFPQLQQILGPEGAPAAIPKRLSLRTWGYQEDSWEALGLPPPPTTVDEYFDLIRLWNDEYASKYPDISFTGDPGWQGTRTVVLSNLKDQYILEHATGKGPVNFNTNDFRKLYADILALPELTYPKRPPDPLICGQYDSDFSSYRLIDMFPDAYVPIFPPQLSKNSPKRIGGDLTMLCVSSSSQNKELAIEYLVFCASHLDMQQQGLSLMVLDENNSPEDLIDTVNGFSMERDAFGMHITAPGNVSYDVDIGEWNRWREFVPFISFHTDALGGYTFSGEIEHMIIIVDGAFHAWEIDGKMIDPFGADDLIENLNRLSQNYFTQWH